MDLLSQNWPWYVSGPIISLVMFLLILFGKNFGISSNLRTICSSLGGKKISDFFDFDWKAQRWNLVIILGAVIGGYLSSLSMAPIEISEATITDLNQIGFKFDGKEMVPPEMFDLSNFTFKKIIILAVGGLLVGFGARYAGGCTSGHAISGLSNLQWPSLIAVIGFFIGGLIMTWLLLPLIF